MFLVVIVATTAFMNLGHKEKHNGKFTSEGGWELQAIRTLQHEHHYVRTPKRNKQKHSKEET
jgi:hypothetical protein